MKSTKDLENNYVFFNTESWDKKSEKEKQRCIEKNELLKRPPRKKLKDS